jgi:hypothetical protein
MTQYPSRSIGLFLFSTLAACAPTEQATDEYNEELGDESDELIGDPEDEVNEDGTGPADVRSANSRSRTGADTARPLVQGIDFGDSNGWVDHRSITIVVDAKDNVGVTEVCLSNTRACRAWVPFDSEGNDHRLPQGVGPHTVRVWARDAAGNISGMFRDTVGIDAKRPRDGTVTASPIPGGVTLNWADFTDPESGIVGYRIVGRQNGAAPYCTVERSIYWEGNAGTATITGMVAGDHAMRVCAIDAQGHMSTGTIVTSGPRAESNAPVVRALQLDGGDDWVPSRTVDVQVDVVDESAIMRMCYSEDTTCRAWTDFEPNTTFTLSPGSGVKTVRGWYEDAFGNINVAATDQIGLDLTAPTDGELTLSHLPSAVRVAWPGAADADSGIVEYVVVMADDTAPRSCSEGEEVYRGTAVETVVSGLTSDFRYGFRVCAIDDAGWMSAGIADQITPLAEYDPPTVTRFVIDEDRVETYDLYVPVQLQAADATGIARMCLSNTATCDTWQTYQTLFNHRLASGAAGERTLYLWLEDTLGNQSAVPFTDTIDYLTE